MSACELVSNVSAQSPPCSRNASPRATAASRSRSWSTSLATTSGGQAGQGGGDLAQRLLVGPRRLLGGRLVPPRVEPERVDGQTGAE